MLIRNATDGDFSAILRLNEIFEEALSPMSLEQLALWNGMRPHFRVACEGGEVIGFLLAFREDANYTSPNFLWFRQRYDRFFYIDRVVIDADHQRKGIGRAFYLDLFERARESGVESVTCEYYSRPLNLVSSYFHAAMGFGEVGTQWLEYCGKEVSMQEARPAWL